MRADDFRRELQELADEQPEPNGDARTVVARGKRRLGLRWFGTAAVALALVGVSVGIVATRDGTSRGVVVAPPPTSGPTTTPTRPQVMFTSESEGWVCGDPILHTADGGEHWQSQSWSDRATGTATCAAVPTEAWIFVQSADGAVTVLPAQGGAHLAGAGDFPTLPAGAKVAQATFVDKNNGWVLVRPAGNPVGKGLLYRTTTGTGPISFELVSSTAPIDQVAFASATEGWGLDGGAIAHTADGGATWTYAGNPSARISFGGGAFVGLAVHGSTVGVIVLEDRAPAARHQILFFVTSNGGEIWGEKAGPLVTGDIAGPSALELIDDSQWRLMLGGRLWAIGDQHAWTEIDAPPNLASMSFPSIESNWVTDTSGAVYRWSDAGPRWERVDTTPQPPWQTNLVAIPGDPGGCPNAPMPSGVTGSIGQPTWASSPDQAARDFVQATRGWTGEKLVASYPVTQPGGQFGSVFAANVPRQCGQVVADASYAVELTNPAITQDNSRSTALVVMPHDGKWQVWGFYR